MVHIIRTEVFISLYGPLPLGLGTCPSCLIPLLFFFYLTLDISRYLNLTNGTAGGWVDIMAFVKLPTDTRYLSNISYFTTVNETMFSFTKGNYLSSLLDHLPLKSSNQSNNAVLLNMQLLMGLVCVVISRMVN